MARADQPRIPKGFVGAGRFMKVGQVLTALKDASHPGDSGDAGRKSEPRLAKVGSKLSRKDAAVERTFASAAEASRPSKSDRTFQTDTGGRISREEAGRRMFGDAGFEAKAASASRGGSLATAGARHPATPEGIASAVREVNATPTEWVSLTDVRPKLGGTRAEQDAALIAAARARQIKIIPEENQKTLTEADRAAAVNIGGEPHHVLMIPRNSPLAR